MKKTDLKKTIKNILLIRTDRIGDVVLTTPAVTLLKNQYPDSKIFFLTRKYTAPLLKHHLFIDEIILYIPDTIHRGLRGIYKLAKELKYQNIDVAFLFYPTPALAFALRVAKIPFRVGSGYRWYSFLFNHRIFEHRSQALKHELEYNLQLIKNFIPQIPVPAEINFKFKLDKDLLKKQLNALKTAKISSPFIIIHPGNGGSAPNLTINQYVKIIQYILKQDKNRVIVVGNKNESGLLHRIGYHINHPRLFILPGKWDIETYMAVIAKCRLFISSSTGPLHIARALNVPLISFYCPALPYTPNRWGPYNQQDSIILPSIDTPDRCSTKKCPYKNCLEKIEWQTIQKVLDKKLSV
jgi:heptosyltransferase-3